MSIQTSRSHVRRVRALRTQLVTVTTVVALAALSGCAGPSGPTFDDLGSVMTSTGVDPNIAWSYESIEQLLPQRRESHMQPAPADVVVVGEFIELTPGAGYSIEGDNPEPVVLGFEDPEALWRDAVMTFDVTDVVHSGTSSSDRHPVEPGLITIRVIVPLAWDISDVSHAYRDQPKAVVFLADDVMSDHFRVLGGVGEFYLPIDGDGELNFAFVTEATRSGLQEFPDHIDDITKDRA